MPPIVPADLPQEVQAILETPAREGACITEQPVCHPDFRVTAQLTHRPPPDAVLKPWRIVNARRGDLLLSPGGPSGLIGGLLSKLDAAQFFSHMGIMVEDEVAVRHATASSDRTTHAMFATGEIFGQPAPTDGYAEESIRFQWPGTITQTIEEAFLTWRDHPYELGADGEPLKYESYGERKIPHKDFSRHDSVTGERYHIGALSFGPNKVLVGETWREIWPLVIKPCASSETTRVRRALHRIADAATRIRAHYRLYCYTRGDISADHLGPAMLEEQQPDPNAGCTGAKPVLVPVERTVPQVCSTFVWWAVQEANKGGGPRIVLDVRPWDRRAGASSACFNNALLAVKPRPNDERVDPNFDGLYRYSEHERQRAANWVHDDYTVALVQRKLDEAMPFLLRAGGATAFLTLAGLFAALKLFPVSFVANMLGVSTLFLNDLVAAFTDMPDDVANQLCNTFASDDSGSGSEDSDEWKDPGTGTTVSPDDILNEWAPTVEQSDEEILGVYGFNERIILRPPEFVRRPPPESSWQISQGFAEFNGRVTLRDSQGTPFGVRGAHVRIGCEKFVAGENGIYSTARSPRGLYWGAASYTDPATGVHCEAEGRSVHVGIPGGTPDDFDFELLPPPDTRREIVIRGRMDLTNRHTIGRDWHDHPQFTCDPVYLDFDCFFFPDEERFKEQRETSRKQIVRKGFPVEDWGHAEIEFTIQIQPDKSAAVSYRARLIEDGEDGNEAEWQASGVVMVPPKASPAQPGVSGPPADMMRAPFSPVRAHIEFEVHNERAR